MITINDFQLRNLEEQVQKNKEDIARHYTIDRVLADFGLTVVGYLENPTLLPGPDGQRPYGTAYLVGTGAPFNVYVWTRANAAIGEPRDYWLNIGPIAIEGPRGPQGVPGPQGPEGKGTEWFVGSSYPSPSFVENNDFFLNVNGDVYHRENDLWVYVTSLKGPQGEQGIRGPEGPQGPRGFQGPKGDTGTPGQAVRIVGKLTSVSQLPAASSSYVGKGYLITSGNITYIYIVKEENSSYQWINAGIFTGATVVSVNGAYVETWDADTKLDKVTGTTDNAQVYAKTKSGGQSVVDLSPGNSVVNSAVVRYSTTGTIRAKNATNTADVVPLNQMNTAIATAKSEISDSLDSMQGEIDGILSDIGDIYNQLPDKSDKLYRHTITFSNMDVLYFFNAQNKHVDVGDFHITFYHYSTQSTPMSYTEIYNLLSAPAYEGTGVTKFTTLPKYISFNAYDNETGQRAFWQVLSARQAEQFILWAMTASVNPEIRTFTVTQTEIYNDNYSWSDTVEEI